MSALKVISFFFFASFARLLIGHCFAPSGYRPPETDLGKPYSGQAFDVFSCGVILFILISGSFVLILSVFPSLLLFSNQCALSFIRSCCFLSIAMSEQGGRSSITRIGASCALRREISERSGPPSELHLHSISAVCFACHSVSFHTFLFTCLRALC